MSATRRPAVMERVAALLIRGPEARYVRADIDDAFDRDLARGLSERQARRRYAINVLSSAVSVAVARVWPSGVRFSLIDVRLGLRMLVKSPGITLVALLTLAVGIPVGLAPMHAVEALGAHLPEDPGGRVQMLRYANAPTTIDDVVHWRAGLTSFETLGASRMRTYNVEIAGTQTLVPGTEVTASTFEILQVQPMWGRWLRPDDESPGSAEVVVISATLNGAAQRAGVDLTGGVVRIGGIPHQVVGIMPDSFAFPMRQQLWVPLRDRPLSQGRSGRALTVFGRLATGVTADDAQVELSSIHERIATENPREYASLNPEVVPTSFMVFGFPRGGLRALPEFPIVQVVTLVPLLIACVNVGLLVFARTARRSGEFAVRTALGASRARILTQVFTESMVLAILATGAGLILLRWLPERVLSGFSFFPMPYWLSPELSTATIVRALALGCVSAVIAGVVPALRATARSVQSNLQVTSGRNGGNRFGLVSGVLIVADVAVALIAVSFSTGVLAHVTTAFADTRADGIQAERYLSVAVNVTAESPESADADRDAYRSRIAATQQALIDRLAAEPGVRAVALGSTLPRMDHRTRFLEVDGEPMASGARGYRVRTAEVGVGFFEALRSPVLSGRTFDGRDVVDGAATVIVNTTFVNTVLGGGSAIGRRLRYRSEGAPAGPWFEIVGVVGHLGMHVLRSAEDDGVYHPIVPGSLPGVRLAIETVSGDPMALMPRVRAIARDIDPSVVVSSPTTLDQVFEGDWYVMRTVVLGIFLFVGVLLALAASGLYAIMSFTVAERTRDIGIRVALGADRQRIVLDVARRALVQIALGVAIGLPIAARIAFELQADAGGAPSAVGSLLYALIPGIGILLIVAMAACIAPVRRALRISPVDALRA